MKIFYYMRRFWEIPSLEKRLLVKSLIISTIYSFIIHFIPLKYYSISLTSSPESHTHQKDAGKIIYLIRKTIKRTNIILPWQNTCLIKSLTFKYLSKDFGLYCKIAIEVFKGRTNKLQAHAYILYDNEPVYLHRKNIQEILAYRAAK